LALVLALLASLIFTASPPAGAEPLWRPAVTPLMTPWTALVGPNNALPEYPRPQMARTSWQNLNGLWDYLGRSGVPVLAASPPPGSYRQQILVPYPPESALSGIGRHDDEMWYRRIFQMNGNWQGQQVLLHFGAVDQVATVWVNGRQMARHEGGYTEFSADITPALRPAGPQEIIVRAEDRNEANPFPVGKQRNRPEGLFYTGSSGIWQTVWLEHVPLAHVEKLHITTDLNAVTVVPKTAGTVDERVIVFVSKQAGRVVAVGSGAWTAVHHAFTAPKPEHLAAIETDPGAVLADAYDIVCNGHEIGGGSIRIHRRDVQEKVFAVMGIDVAEAREKFDLDDPMLVLLSEKLSEMTLTLPRPEVPRASST
jgi:hypothetical protein